MTGHGRTKRMSNKIYFYNIDVERHRLKERWVNNKIITGEGDSQFHQLHFNSIAYAHHDCKYRLEQPDQKKDPLTNK